MCKKNPVYTCLGMESFQKFSIRSQVLHINHHTLLAVCKVELQRDKILHLQPLETHEPPHGKTICIGENKDADQLRSNHKAYQRLCFRYSDSTIPFLLKSEISRF